MKRGKRGISSIIATILILLVVVAAITIIWAAILPTIKNSLDETEFSADLTISKSGYTYWDKNNNITCVQIMNNGDEIEGIDLIFKINKESYSEIISKSETPSKNQAKKICRKLPGKPDEIKVAPIIKKGDKLKIGSVTSSLTNIPDGDYPDNPDNVLFLDYKCVNGNTRQCSTGQPGICSDGTQECVNEQWEFSCSQDNQATTEICNNIDDDCDGTIDNGNLCPIGFTCTLGVCSQCINGETQSCNTGLLGICSDGTQECVNNQWESCIQDNQLQTEVCTDNLDNNCNGLTDCEDNLCKDNWNICIPVDVMPKMTSNEVNGYKVSGYCDSGGISGNAPYLAFDDDFSTTLWAELSGKCSIVFEFPTQVIVKGYGLKGQNTNKNIESWDFNGRNPGDVILDTKRNVIWELGTGGEFKKFQINNNVAYKEYILRTISIYGGEKANLREMELYF